VNMYVAFCVLSPVSNLPAKEGSHKVIHFKQDPTYILSSLPGTIRRDPSGVKAIRRKKEDRDSSIHILNCLVPALCNR